MSRSNSFLRARLLTLSTESPLLIILINLKTFWESFMQNYIEECKNRNPELFSDEAA